MKLIDAMQYKGLPYKVENCGRDELPEFFKQMGYKIGAEVGVYKGEYAELFCKEGMKMFVVDPWHSYAGAGRSQKRQERQDFLYGHTQRLLKKYNDCTIIRKASADAVKDFKDGSLDFVYIDGDHSFKHVAQDIYNWNYKIRKGGCVAGHDYFTTDKRANNVICHVGPVVDAFVKAFGIENFYTFGRTKPLEDEKRYDKTLSWLWIKK